jgi:hypothetical protein
MPRPQLTPHMRNPKTPAERIRLFRRRRKFGRQVVKVEVDPGEVDALIDRGALAAQTSSRKIATTQRF